MLNIRHPNSVSEPKSRDAYVDFPVVTLFAIVLARGKSKSVFSYTILHSGLELEFLPFKFLS